MAAIKDREPGERPTGLRKLGLNIRTKLMTCPMMAPDKPNTSNGVGKEVAEEVDGIVRVRPGGTRSNLWKMVLLPGLS